MLPLFKRLWKVLDRSDHLQIGGAMGLVTLGALLEMIGVGLLPILVAVLSVPETVLEKVSHYTGDASILHWDQTKVVLVTISVVSVFFIFKNLFSMWATHRLGVFKAYLQTKLGRRLLHGYLHAPYEWHLNHSASSIQHIVQVEVHFLLYRILTPIFTLVSEAAVIFLVISLLMIVSPVATLATAAVIAATSITYSLLFKGKLLQLGELQRESGRALVRCVQYALGGIKELKVLGRTAYYENEYNGLVGDLSHTDQVHGTISTNVKAVLEGLAVICLSASVFINILLGHNLELLLPQLALFAVAATRLMPSANRVVVVQGTLRLGLPGLTKLVDDLEEVQNFGVAPVLPVTNPIPPLAREIVLRDLVYRYPLAPADSVNGINLSIRQGDSVAFVGSSGAGKTTIVDLILGLLQPTGGAILVDGRDIRDDIPGWQKQVGYIPQNIYLVDDSIRSNIAFGLPPEQIKDEQVWEALRSAQLADLVASWPEGLDRTIGDRGVRLSGGQRQRIGIARALYHRPPVLVLDEATAALDNQTERDIVAVLEKFRGEKTLITIAHRLTTVQRCNHLFYLEAGKVVATGSYRQLEAECPQFSRMVQVAHANDDAL